MSQRRARAQRKARIPTFHGKPPANIKTALDKARAERDKALAALTVEFTKKTRDLHDEWATRRRKVWQDHEQSRAAIVKAWAKADADKEREAA
jgi:hypothetical protein